MASQNTSNLPLRPEWLDPTSDPLTGGEGREAVKAQIIDTTPKYRKVVRGMADPPVVSQTVGLISFNLLPEPVLLKGKPVYGFVKIRGNYTDVDSSIREASKIVKETDSMFKIRIAPVGQWVPITEADSVVKEMIDVKTDGGGASGDNDNEVQMPQLRDLATLQKQKEQEKIMRELKARAEDAEAHDVYDDQESLEFYVMKRVTDMTLLESYEIALNKLEEIKNKLFETRMKLKTLDVANPEYDESWLDFYNASRKERGITGEFVPTDSYLKYYEDGKLPTGSLVNH